MNVEEWVDKKAEHILKEFGIKDGFKILDFGCGSGVYSKIISNIIGNKGKVYALDYDNNKLEELSSNIKSSNIKNVDTIKSSKEINFPFQSNFFDVIILYDVWHLLDDNQRLEFLKESRRTLKKGGFISYLATHLYDPKVNLEESHRLMKEHDFILLEKFNKPMFHWNWIEECQIFNYYKK